MEILAFMTWFFVFGIAIYMAWGYVSHFIKECKKESKSYLNDVNALKYGLYKMEENVADTEQRCEKRWQHIDSKIYEIEKYIQSIHK